MKTYVEPNEIEPSLVCTNSNKKNVQISCSFYSNKTSLFVSFSLKAQSELFTATKLEDQMSLVSLKELWYTMCQRKTMDGTSS